MRRYHMDAFSALLALYIPLTKANDAERFLWSAPEQTVEQTIETPVIWDAIAHIMTSLWYMESTPFFECGGEI